MIHANDAIQQPSSADPEPVLLLRGDRDLRLFGTGSDSEQDLLVQAARAVPPALQHHLQGAGLIHGRQRRGRDRVPCPIAEDRQPGVHRAHGHLLHQAGQVRPGDLVKPARDLHGALGLLPAVERPTVRGNQRRPLLDRFEEEFTFPERFPPDGND